MGVRRTARIGNPDRRKICASQAERANLSVRLFNRRFTRLILVFEEAAMPSRSSLLTSISAGSTEHTAKPQLKQQA